MFDQDPRESKETWPCDCGGTIIQMDTEKGKTAKVFKCDSCEWEKVVEE